MTVQPCPTRADSMNVAVLGKGATAARYAVELVQANDKRRVRLLCATSSDESLARQALSDMVEARAEEARRNRDEVAAHVRRIEVMSGPVRDPALADVLIDADDSDVRSWARVDGVAARQTRRPAILLAASCLDLTHVPANVLDPKGLLAVALFARSGPVGAAEIATTPETGREAASTAQDLIRATGRVVMNSHGSTGTFVARVRSAFEEEVQRLAAEGAAPRLLTEVCKQQGLPKPLKRPRSAPSSFTATAAAYERDIADRLFLRVAMAALDGVVRGDVADLASADVGLRWGFGARFGTTEAIARMDAWRGGMHGVTLTASKAFSSPSMRFTPPSVIGEAARKGCSLRATIEFGSFGSHRSFAVSRG